MIKDYFNNSAAQFAFSFFTNETKLNLTDLEEIKRLVDQKIKNQKKSKYKIYDSVFDQIDNLSNRILFLLPLFPKRSEDSIIQQILFEYVLDPFNIDTPDYYTCKVRLYFK